METTVTASSSQPGPSRTRISSKRKEREDDQMVAGVEEEEGTREPPAKH
jgi:hypothetical protein